MLNSKKQMVKKNTKVKKVIDEKEYVFQCIVCNHKYIGTKAFDLCPACNRSNVIAMRSDFMITK